jgi:predicted DNA-binding transcriptional regulator YafY
MPTPLSSRLHRLALLHGCLAGALAEGLPGLITEEVLEHLGGERKSLYRCAQELREMDAPIEYDSSTHLWRYREVWNPPFPWAWTFVGAPALNLSLLFLLDPDLRKALEGVIHLEPEIRSRGQSTLPRLTARFERALLPQIAKALRDKRRIRFVYTKPDGSMTQREVGPLELFEWNGMPYLQAVDLHEDRPVVKRFALSRMTRIAVTEERFRQPAKRDVPSCLGAYCADVFTATIRADAHHAAFVRERRWHKDQLEQAMNDGSFHFTLPFGNAFEAARWILGQGSGFVPVAPVALVEAWKSEIRKLSLLAA